MLDAIVHRGPNSHGTYLDGPIAMGMRRLSIIDLSGGDQPISNAAGTIWTVSNGEIYNFQEVRQELQRKGYQFKTHSDTEVIVHAYEEWGDKFVERLDGMFGTAVWDSQKQKLILLRDRLGIKPLYTMRRGNSLAFASEMKSIFAGGFISPEVDPEILQEYLAFGYAVAPNTIAKGIEKLAPGELMTWERGEIKRRTYWSLPQTTFAVPPSPEETLEKFREAITSHLIADVPLGSFLSGGIDSSGIVGVMDDYLQDPVNTYAIGYKGDAVAEYFSELTFAREVASSYSTNHREIEVKPDVTDLLPTLMWHLEEPISDTATMTTYLVSQLASESVTVIMSGVGGDELFAGYRRYLGDYYRSKYLKIPRWLRSTMIEPMIELLPSGRDSRLQDLGRYAKEFTSSAELSWEEQYRGYLTIGDPSRLSHAVQANEYGAQQFLNVCHAAQGSDPLQRLMYVDLQTQLPEALLLLSDKMTMACSLECRVPFLHHPFVEFAAQIDSGAKLANGNLKSLLKASLKGVLPESVLTRKKRGFGAPLGNWLKGELTPLAVNLLNKRQIDHRGLLSPAGVESVLSAHRSNQQDHTDLIMVLMNLELWMRVFIDGQSPQVIAEEIAA